MLATPISMMAGWSECRLGHFVRAVCAAALVALVQFPSTCRAEPIIVADIEYTHDGSTDEEGRAAIETYLRFFLNKRYGGRVESIADYIRYCNSGRWPKSGDDSCP